MPSSTDARDTEALLQEHRSALREHSDVNAKLTIRRYLPSLSTVLLVCVVGTLSYLAPRLEGALISTPRTIWPMWPGCAILVSALLLAPLRIWPILIPVAFSGFTFYDLEVGVPVGSITWFMVADTVQVLVAALALRYFFDGVPRLNNVKALAKYSLITLILAPSAAAFLSARGIQSDYWNGWRISFVSEVLAFVTIAPAILSWVSEGRAWARKPYAYHVEAAALFGGLLLLGIVTFTASGRSSSPALLYSLIPFLLWSALRFGSLGTSTSILAVAFLAIWGAVHGRGPFTEGDPHGMFPLQLFLIFAAIPFMVLAALVEDRKVASRELSESESRYRRIVETTNEGVWLLDAKLHTVYVNRQMAEMIGYEPPEIIGQSIFKFYFPEDISQKKQALERRQQGVREQFEERMRRKDGSELWVRISAIPLYNDGGQFDGALGMVADFTHRKLAEDALAAVSRKLVLAREQERTRIARELHDDIGQRLALMAVEMENLRSTSPGLPSETRSRIGELQKRTREIATDTQSLSHELHPSKVQYLGLTTAMRSFCREFSEQHNVKVDLSLHELPGPLSPDISLCFFRVLQEALNNSAKHSGAAVFDVELWSASDEIHLTVADSGKGFDTQVAKRESRGLGLISMEERLKLLQGTLSIESQLQRGTTIHARVPLSSGRDSMLAAE
jgi:PAS domain S-box-containing protein